MKIILRFIFFSGMIALFNGCESPVDLQLDNYKPQLAVVSNFSQLDKMQVYVSKTRNPITPSDAEYITNAKVDLYLGKQLLETLLLVPGAKDIPPFYTTVRATPRVGSTYTLKVQSPGFETVEATSTIPFPIGINSLITSDASSVPGTKPLQTKYSYNVNIRFNEPGDAENFYHLNFYQQVYRYRVENSDTVLLSEFFLKRKFSSIMDENTMISYFDGGVLFEDTALNGTAVNFTFPLDVEYFPERELLGNVYAELRTVSKEYYLYHNSLSRQQTSAGGPFAEPVILYNNIENGQGIFAGYSAVFDSIAIKR